MLPRSLNELYENIRDFFVYAEGGKIYGCCALHVDWENLAEIKSLAVSPVRTGRDIGTKLIRHCLRDTKGLRIGKVFALTYVPEFFEHFGFQRISKRRLPHKIWTECIRCIHFPRCKEVAVMREL